MKCGAPTAVKAKSAIGLSVPEVFFFPVKIFAMSALLKLATLLLQGVLIGWLVVPREKHAMQTVHSHS